MLFCCVVCLVVPVYVFGEDKLYTSISLLSRFRRMLARSFRVGIPFFFGRFDCFGLLPHRVPLHAVIGAPIWPVGVGAEQQKAIGADRLRVNAPEALRAEKAKQIAAAAAANNDANKRTKDKSASTPLPPPTVGASGVSFHHGRRVPKHVTPQEVEEMHARYVEAMQQLFDKHKTTQPGYEKSTLNILAAK